MRASLKTTIVASLAALTLVAGVVSTDAKPFFKPMGGPHPWHHGFGPGLAFGVIGAGIAAAAIANSCTVYQPVYDPYGNYLGQQPVNTCQ